MAIAIKKRAAGTKSKLASNKGITKKHSSKKSDSNIAYRGNGYYITKPIIDKISICGEPRGFTDEDKKLFNGGLFFEAMAKKEGRWKESRVEIFDPKLKGGKSPWFYTYKNHFKITPPGTKQFMTFFFEPWPKRDESRQEKRFLRMEFNPNKMGAKNVQFLIDWYDNTMAGHAKFKDIASTKKCISYVHIAIDVVGIHISDMVLNFNKGKGVQWHSEGGLLESFYSDSKPGETTDLKIYDKLEEEAQEDQANNYNEKDELAGIDDGKFDAGSQKTSMYESGQPVTRIELIVRTTHPLTKLHTLDNKFKNIKIFRLDETSPALDLIPEGRHNLDLLLDSVRMRGKKNALRLLPEKLRPKYLAILSHALENVMEGYNETEKWQKYWKDSVRKSGLLH